MKPSVLYRILPVVALVALAACVEKIDNERPDTAAVTSTAGGDVQAQPAPAPAPDTTSAMRLEVDLTARKLYVFDNGQPTDTHDVAVGTAEWPTKTGDFRISQVVWNPEWVPPTDESWAKDEKPKAPGDRDNPLGRAQLVYDPPRSIHGTNEPSSIGKAASHGSIRMRNATILELAEQVVRAGGAPKDSIWVLETRANRKTKQVVDLPRPVPIVIR
jgi:lipoprotein-anchoring transpeptidase ErfK/SrfK